MKDNRFCTNCGTSNKAEAKFCTNCGADMMASSPTTTAKKKQPAWLWVAVVAVLCIVCMGLIAGLYIISNVTGMDLPNPFASKTPTFTMTPTVTSTPTLTPTPILGIGSTRIRQDDGMIEVFVPAGSFMMGDTSSTADSNESPIHRVSLDAFWIDKTEVTNLMFHTCVDAGACNRPSETDSKSRSSYFNNSNYNHYPVINVSWDDAFSYCRWVGARLPTEAEWEFAARGESSLKYPWGNGAPSSSFANYGDNLNDTTAVGSYPDGASPYGALDMAGNVYEWVADWYDSDYYEISPDSNPKGPNSGTRHVTRGGSYEISSRYIRGANRNSITNDADDLGFRCAQNGYLP
ncbi:SUMF1/EgtB/PvdO family nonheme iron enzyme [Chloroflexota bacterium]